MPRLSVVVLALCAVAAAAQPTVPVGVVWTIPEDSVQALADLAAMEEAGVRAVQTDLVENDAVLAAADQRGIALYQNLPVANLPAERLRDTLAFADRMLREALARSRPYRSARHFGLAVGSDTSDPAACGYFERLHRVIDENGPPGSTAYYVSRFVEADVCRSAVDLVLLDARDEDPAGVLARGRRALTGTALGLGAVGWAVEPGATEGHRVLGSTARQARALEEAMPEALALDPYALFVYRWRDSDADAALLATDATTTEYGLHDADGQPRPALDVVRGLYTGQQTLFALDAGYPPQGRRPTLLVMVGWLLVLSLAFLHWNTPTFQLLATEHLVRPTMYQDAVRRARGVESWPTAALAGVLALSFGVVWGIALRTLGHTEGLTLLASGLPEHILRGLNLLLRQPALLVVLLASLYALGLLLNVILMAVLAPPNRLLPAQALTLAVWARSLMLLPLGVAMVVASQPPSLGLALVALGLLAAWLVLELVAQVRSLIDLAGVARMGLGRVLGVGFLVPFALTVLTLGFVAAAARPELLFLWHVVTRS
ncbi:MAG: hypothetical protein AAGG50_08345 [Bacteroidota bacterium]